ncbi:MAG: Ig-like domain-containing protein [Acholeplasmataceae bacterium]|nr:Ig-like domain-containing protein [Acholeplasmataceae bacterium]
MFRFKRVFGLILVAFTVVILASCGGDYKLSVHSDKTTIGVGEKVTLSAKLNAKGEEITNIMDSLEFSSSDDAILSVTSAGVVEGLKAGSATISATMTYNETDLEAKIKITVKALPNKPTNLLITEDVLTWTAVTGASSYLVKVNGVDHTVSSPTFNLGDLALAYGSYEVQVLTKVGEDYSLAAVITYTVVDPELEANTYAAVLARMDATYLPDMTETDFYYEYEWQAYLVAARYARAYTNGAMVGNIPLSKTVSVFDAFESITFGDIESYQDIFNELDKFVDIDLTAAQIAAVLIEVVDVILEQQIEVSEASQLYYEDRLDEELLNKNMIVYESQYLELMAGINTYGSPADVLALNNYMDNNLVFYGWVDYQNAIHDIVFDLNDQNTASLNHYRSAFPEDEALQAIVNIVETAFYAEDTEFLAFLEYSISLIDAVRYHNESISAFESMMAQEEDKVLMLESIRLAFTENKQDLRTSLTATIDYILDLYVHIDGDFINVLDTLAVNGLVSPAEVIILKNELVGLFRDTLPTASEFEDMYLALVIVLNHTFDISPTEMVGFAASLGTSTNLSIDLMLELLDDINLKMVLELEAIIEGMIIPSYDYYSGDTYDYRKVVELIVYLGNFKKDFTTEHAIKIAALEAVNTSTFETQIALVSEKVITKIMELSGADASSINSLITLLANQNAYKDIDKIIAKYGNEVFDYFVETNGKIALDIIDLIEIAPEWDDVKAQNAALRVIGSAIFTYHDMILPELTDAEIDIIAEFILNVGVSNIFFANIGMSEAALDEYQAFITDITPSVKTLLKNAIKVEIAFSNALETNDAFYEFANLSDVFNANEALLVQITLALDSVLTETNKDLIDTSVALFFDEIMAHEFILELSGMTTVSVTEQKTHVLAILDTLYLDVERVSAYDFYHLTSLQLDDFRGIWQFGATSPETN